MDRLDNRHLTELARRELGSFDLGRARVGEAVVAVLKEWRDQDPRTAQTVTRMGEIVVRFGRRLEATGTDTVQQIGPAECRSFVDAPSRTGDPPSTGTRHFRRVTLRAFFKTLRHLGVDVGDPTVDLALPSRRDPGARPLTDAEIVLCREAAFSMRLRDLRRPSAWALAEATAATSEIPRLRASSLDDPRRPRQVKLPGTRRLRARSVSLTDWGSTILTQRLAELPAFGDPLLVYTGRRGEDTVAAQAAVCSLIGIVLDTAGLSAERAVRPASVRHWRARSDFDGGTDIATIANQLGHRSLDETAEAIGWDWAS